MEADTTERKSSILADFFDEDELSVELGVAKISLARWRMLRQGPPVTHIGRRVFYRKSSVRNWVVAQEHAPATKPTA
jgi:hypothetical protein